MTRKLCKDCKWFFMSRVSVNWDECQRPQRSLSLIRGEPERIFALEERTAIYGKCGRKAKYFEPANSLSTSE